MPIYEVSQTADAVVCRTVRVEAPDAETAKRRASFVSVLEGAAGATPWRLIGVDRDAIDEEHVEEVGSSAGLPMTPQGGLRLGGEAHLAGGRLGVPGGHEVDPAAAVGIEREDPDRLLLEAPGELAGDAARLPVQGTAVPMR